MNPTTVVVAHQKDGTTTRTTSLAQDLELLIIRIRREPLEIVPRKPRPLGFKGQRWPARYDNFYIGNSAIGPNFNDPHVPGSAFDTGQAFQTERSSGITALIWFGDGHAACLSQHSRVTVG